MKKKITDPNELVKQFYNNFYDKTFNGDGLNGWAYRKTHKDLEKMFRRNFEKNILEIGAGNAQHLEFVKHDFLRYTMVDLCEQPKDLNDLRYKWIQGNIEEQQFEANHFDRILSMCVFHHLDNPEKVMQLINVWLKPGGTFSLFLPLDPSFANRMNRRFIVLPRARKLGFAEYEVVNALEHKNHFWGLKTMLTYFFRDYEIQVEYKPFAKRVALLNLYSIWHLRKPLD
jgi:SAM-dependent methyltransferase